MNENDNTYYDSEKKKIPLLKILLIVIFLIIIIVLLVTIFSKPKTNSYDELLNATRNYLSTNSDKKPTTIGTCSIVGLSELNTKLVKNCNSEKTYVKVCMVDEDNYQYTTVLSCNTETTIFGDPNPGVPL